MRDDTASTYTKELSYELADSFVIGELAVQVGLN